MNGEMDIKKDMDDMWNRFKDFATTTLRTKAIRQLGERLDEVEEIAQEDHGTLEKIVRGVLGIAGSVGKKKK
jgi:hypothetical protein